MDIFLQQKVRHTNHIAQNCDSLQKKKKNEYFIMKEIKQKLNIMKSEEDCQRNSSHCARLAVYYTCSRKHFTSGY